MPNSTNGVHDRADAASQETRRTVEEIHDSQADLRSVASRVGMTLDRLGAWMAQPENSAVVDGLLRLDDARLQLLLNHYRRSAAGTLVRLANSDKPDELARRASVDLLRIEAGSTRARTAARQRTSKASKITGAESASAADLAPPDVERILNVLQQVGDVRSE